MALALSLAFVGWAGEREAWSSKVRDFTQNVEPNVYYDWILGR